MSHHTRTAVVLTLLASLLGACTNPTAPTSSRDCSGGVGAGTGQC